MVQNSEGPGKEIEAAKDGFGGADYFSLMIVLCAAVAVDLLTGVPILGAAIVAVHAGWKSFRCGLWLMSADPLRSRAWPCLWFYMAAAFWRASVSAFLVFLIFIAIDLTTGQPPPLDDFIANMLIITGGVGLSTTIGILAVVSALRNRVRAWVHPSVRDKCRGDFNRLAYMRGFFLGDIARLYRGFNYAIFIVAMSLFVPIVAAGAAVLLLTPQGNGANDFTVAQGIGMILGVFGPLAMIPVYGILSHRVVARTPSDCWPRQSLPG